MAAISVQDEAVFSPHDIWAPAQINSCDQMIQSHSDNTVFIVTKLWQNQGVTVTSLRTDAELIIACLAGTLDNILLILPEIDSYCSTWRALKMIPAPRSPLLWTKKQGKRPPWPWPRRLWSPPDRSPPRWPLLLGGARINQRPRRKENVADVVCVVCVASGIKKRMKKKL